MNWQFIKYQLKAGLICILICFSFKGFSQTEKENKQNFLYGEYYFKKGYLPAALDFYLFVNKSNPENANVNYRIGECYFGLKGKEKLAIPYFEAAVKNINPKYVEGKYKKTEAPPEAWLELANAYHWDQQLEKALMAYNEYKNWIKRDKKKLEETDRKIQQLETARKYIINPLNIRKVNLGEKINTRFTDYNPVISGDKSTMVYTSFWESVDRIFMSKRIDGEWSAWVDISKEIGSEGDCYSAALSYDGKELYIIQLGIFDGDIFVSKSSKRGKWSRMELLEGKVNSDKQETGVSISPDGKVLYFCSNRNGGEGEFDIYRATRKNGIWDDVENLGPVINTPYNEKSPFIMDDGKTLYFSSEGFENMGGSDVFFSVLNENNRWSAPQNVGYPVSTTRDDDFILAFDEGKTLYFSRDFDDGFGRNDIYSVQILPPEEKTAELSVQPINEIMEDNYQTNTAITATEDIDLQIPIQENVPEKVEETDFSENLASNEFENEQAAISQNEQSDIIKDEQPAITQNKILQDNKGVPLYTIQIIALKNPVNTSYFRNLKNVKISRGDDGFHRYTYGEYPGYSIAETELLKVRKLGYPNAFIRKVESVQNY
ncbi:MAG: PD40 domain-containing protein [Bacteroidales bacterium]|nr:PD40 domain-containing protein [Bacteroidales bacterium]